MFFTFEISNPCQWRPFFFKSSAVIRCGWLWFSIGWHPMREDEYFYLIQTGMLEWKEAERYNKRLQPDQNPPRENSAVE